MPPHTLLAIASTHVLEHLFDMIGFKNVFLLIRSDILAAVLLRTVADYNGFGITKSENRH